MKEILNDLVQHTYLMGLFPYLKIFNKDNQTFIESMAEDKSVVLKAFTHNIIPEFDGTFGMSNIEKLNILLKCPEYKDEPNIKIIRELKDDILIPTTIEFNNKDNDFKNCYRLMNSEIINEKLKSVKLKTIFWEIDIEPSDSSIYKFKYQVNLNSQDKNFNVSTVNNNLIFSFGNQLHNGSFIFHKDIEKKLRNNFSWPIAQTMSLLNLDGYKKIKFSSEGAMMITVRSEYASYEYVLPAKA